MELSAHGCPYKRKQPCEDRLKQMKIISAENIYVGKSIWTRKKIWENGSARSFALNEHHVYSWYIITSLRSSSSNKSPSPFLHNDGYMSNISPVAIVTLVFMEHSLYHYLYFLPALQLSVLSSLRHSNLFCYLFLHRRHFIDGQRCHGTVFKWYTDWCVCFRNNDQSSY